MKSVRVAGSPAMESEMGLLTEQLMDKEDSMRAILIITVQEKQSPEGNADIHMSVRATKEVTPEMIADILRDMAKRVIEENQSKPN